MHVTQNKTLLQPLGKGRSSELRRYARKSLMICFASILALEQCKSALLSHPNRQSQWHKWMVIVTTHHLLYLFHSLSVGTPCCPTSSVRSSSRHSVTRLRRHPTAFKPIHSFAGGELARLCHNNRFSRYPSISVTGRSLPNLKFGRHATTSL